MPTPSQDWTPLMLQAISGNESAYRQVLSLVAPAVRAKVKRHVRLHQNDEDAEDVVQEILLAIHLKRGSWDQSRPFAPWVWGIVRYKIIDVLRRRGAKLEDNTELTDELFDTADTYEGAGGDVERLLSRLKDRDQTIVRRSSLQGATPTQIATELGMTEGAVRVALHRALKQLAALCRQEKE
jgi:RNA polymerase sigma factor (sigma-70 family)